MKKLSILLAERDRLLRQARLANLAYTYQSLRDIAARIARAQLRGNATLKPVAPAEERFCVSLTAHDANQSVVEEHFTDEDLLELADVLAFITGDAHGDLTFRFEDLGEGYLALLRAELEREGVALDGSGAPMQEQSQS